MGDGFTGTKFAQIPEICVLRVDFELWTLNPGNCRLFFPFNW